MSKILSVPHHPQLDDGYCLPACVQMVLAYWGIERAQRDIADDLGLIPVPGNRIKMLSSKKLDVSYGVGELADLEGTLAQGVPPIALVYTGELPYWEHATAHAVVLLGMAEQTIYLNDPAIVQGNIAVPLGDFELAWEEMANLYAAIEKR
jgi:ABC-type bacteriocin/lantibiotic exporter with double-glycine peptidase domain